MRFTVLCLRISARCVYTVKPHQPSIRFPERRSGQVPLELNTSDIVQKVEPHPSSFHRSQETPTSVNGRQDLETFLSLPKRYRKRQLSEAEIEAINLGGQF